MQLRLPLEVDEGALTEECLILPPSGILMHKFVCIPGEDKRNKEYWPCYRICASNTQIFIIALPKAIGIYSTLYGSTCTIGNFKFYVYSMDTGSSFPFASKKRHFHNVEAHHTFAFSYLS
jgi:hypothetical protein